MMEELRISMEKVSCNGDKAGSLCDTAVWTPLQYACAVGNAASVSEIIAAKPEIVRASGNTPFAYSPLHLAVRFEHEVIVNLLLSASQSTNVNVADDQMGCTPLHLAILQGNEAIVKLLLDDINIKHLASKNGTSPLDLAKELGLSSIQTLLLDHATRASHRTQLVSWLASIGLVEYAPNFFNEGFDDANFLLGIGGLHDKTLDAMHVQKAGHRAKLQCLYQLKEFLQVESEEDDDVSKESQEEEDSDSSQDESEQEESDSDVSRSDDESS